MSLHRATLFLLLGSVYTVLHKLAHGLFPSLRELEPVRVITAALWTVSTFSLALFAYQYLKELTPGDRRMRYSLIGIIVFTSGEIVSRLLFGQVSEFGLVYRVVFGLSSMFNSFALFLFALSFARLLTKGARLWWPIHAVIWCCGVTSVLGVISFGGFVAYLLSGQEILALPILQPLAMLVFLVTYGATIWFLARFWGYGDYREFIGR
jgi:hypothetical protein